MKHLKLFEKKGDIFWIVIYENYENVSVNTQNLFDDEESAINYYIELVNKLNDDNDDIIATKDDADAWVDENCDSFYVQYKEIISKGKYKLSKRLRMAHDIKKYNL